LEQQKWDARNGARLSNDNSGEFLGFSDFLSVPEKRRDGERRASRDFPKEYSDFQGRRRMAGVGVGVAPRLANA